MPVTQAKTPFVSVRTAKPFAAAICALLALTFCCPQTFGAGAADPEFTAFWAKFKLALQKNDKNAIAGMTKLPYVENLEKLNRQQFLQQYPRIFKTATRHCLTHQNPVRDKGGYFAFCGEEIFIFSKVNGKNYAFVEIGAND